MNEETRQEECIAVSNTKVIDDTYQRRHEYWYLDCTVEQIEDMIKKEYGIIESHLENADAMRQAIAAGVVDVYEKTSYGRDWERMYGYIIHNAQENIKGLRRYIENIGIYKKGIVPPEERCSV